MAVAGRPELAADYVIVGGGSAGAAIAARLSEDPACQVLLIEAGEAPRGLVLRAPPGVFQLIGNPRYDWNRPGQPDSTAGGRALPFPAGKALGGSSAINGLVYGRGSRGDYDRWVEAGAEGWGYDAVLPYFLRAEGYRGAPSQAHSAFGPVGVTPTDLHPLARRFIAAGAAAGMPAREDYCTEELTGSFPTHGTIARGRRSDTYHAYLEPARARANLRVLTGAVAERLTFAGRRATGVLFRQEGQTREATARGEVIVSAGAFGSPLLLQRSGVGPADVLAAAGVVPLLDLPGVGENLQDHLGNGISRFVDAASFNTLRRPWNAAAAALRWLVSGTGPIASASVQAMAYGRSRADAAEPDYMLSFLPVCVDFSTGKPRLHRRNGVFIATNVCRPQTRGRVAITGPDSAAAARIDLPLLAEDEDVRVLLHSLKLIERIYAEGFGDILSAEQDEPLPTDDAEWLQWLRERTSLGYHSVGTCRMGGADAVLDPELRVRGIAGLRVADASAIPRLISANTNAAAIMIGERAADLIRGGQRG